MKVVLLAGLAILAAVSAGVFFSHIRTGPTPVPAGIIAKYTAWKKQFGKLYSTPSENDYRLRVFHTVSDYIDESNNDYESAIKSKGETLSGPMFALNNFADLSEEEFKAKYTGAATDTASEVESDESVPAKPVEVGDELKSEKRAGLGQGFDIRIRNQGACGSCWAFAAVAAFEKHYYDKARQRLEFSQQELVDCDRSSGGCGGGYENKAVEYIYRTGISPAGNYPYTGTQGACRSGSTPRTKIGIYMTTKAYSSGAAQYAASKGLHASLSMFATGKARFLSNTNDIYDAPSSGECFQNMNHFVNLVGYEGNRVVQMINSWGRQWANGGSKRIRTCSDASFWGGGSRITYLE